MVVTEISMIHHVGIVLVLLWLLNSYNCCHPVVYFVSLIYLYQIHERYIIRLRRKLQFEERKVANQRRILTDSETVRWLNHAVERIWPICMEQIISQRIFLPIIPWFLKKYKPWTVRKAVVQHLYLGRTPPLFTDIRVLRESTDDDHLVLELGLNFLTADDMSAILSAKLRKRLGFGIAAKLHLTGMHVEGKVLVGVKFLRSWPFIGRLRVCFAEPPYFQMTVKPIFNHGLDVTEVPGIAGWLDNLLAIAFEETLVEPNMLVVDLEKFVSPQPENWFSIDVKEPLAYANVEVIEAAELKPSDLNGLADPYVKGHLGQYRFRTQIQRKTLTPKWQEEFKIPICSWDAQNVLTIEVCDKDRFVDDILGNCSVNISELKDGQRHDMWLPLENVKLGRLHLAITIVGTNGKGEEVKIAGEKPNSLPSEMAEQEPISTAPKKNPQKTADTFEAINVEGQNETGIWVHHPGSEISQAWEPRKGKSRHIDNEILSVESHTPSDLQNDSSSSDESKDGHSVKRPNIFQRGLHKIFHRHHGKEDRMNSFHEIPSPHANVKASHVKKVGVNLKMDDELSEHEGGSNNVGSGAESSGKHYVKGMSKNMSRNDTHSSHQLKQTFSEKGSTDFLDASEKGVPLESYSSDEDSESLEGIPISSTFIPRSANDEVEPKERVLTEEPTTKVSLDGSFSRSRGNYVLSNEQPLNPKFLGREVEEEER